MLERYRNEVAQARRRLAEALITSVTQLAMNEVRASFDLGYDSNEHESNYYSYVDGKIIKTTFGRKPDQERGEIDISILNPDIIGKTQFAGDKIEELAANIERSQRELNRSQTSFK